MKIFEYEELNIPEFVEKGKLQNINKLKNVLNRHYSVALLEHKIDASEIDVTKDVEIFDRDRFAYFY